MISPEAHAAITALIAQDDRARVRVTELGRLADAAIHHDVPASFQITLAAAIGRAEGGLLVNVERERWLALLEAK